MKVSGLKETIDWYDNNADKYSLDTRDKKFSDTAKSFLDKISIDTPRVLDAGCGDGRDSATLASFGAQVTGIDISKGLIKVAKKLHSDIEFVHGNFIELPFSNETFDGVWAHASLVHLETIDDVRNTLREFKRVLKTNGWVYIYVKEQLGNEKTEVVSDKLSNHDRFFRYYKSEELKGLLEETGFKVDEVVREEDVHGRAEIKWIRIFAKLDS